MNDVTAAPVEIWLGDEKYEMSPLTDRDICELDNYLRSRVIRMAREACEGASAEVEEKTMRHAFSYANSLTWLSMPGGALMSDMDGLARLIWMGIRSKHPGMTPEKVRSLILDQRTLDHAMDAWRMINGVELDKEGEQPEKKGPRENEPTDGKFTGSSLSDTDGPQEQLLT